MKWNGLISYERLVDFWDILRQVDPEGLVRDAHQPFRLVIVGPAGVGKRALAAALSGLEVDRDGDVPPVVEVFDMPSDLPVALPSADGYLYVTAPTGRPSPAQREQLRLLVRRTNRLLVVLNPSGQDPAWVADTREELSLWLAVEPERVLVLAPRDRGEVGRVVIPRIIALAPGLALSMGRRLPPFRDAAAEALIGETARINAEFVVVASIPAAIPVIGTIAAAGADLLVLTKNQIMLLLRLAILYQRPVDNRLQVLSEVMPVVGAAFFWRTAARTLVSLIPGPLAVAPQAGIAYVGTFVVGKMAQYYYRWGKRPSPVLLAQFRQDALEHLNAAAPMLARVGRILRLP